MWAFLLLLSLHAQKSWNGEMDSGMDGYVRMHVGRSSCSFIFLCRFAKCRHGVRVFVLGRIGSIFRISVGSVCSLRYLVPGICRIFHEWARLCEVVYAKLQWILAENPRPVPAVTSYNTDFTLHCLQVRSVVLNPLWESCNYPLVGRWQ